eukprot:6184047-Pleurochrysis_carterae.AAC.1
MKEIKYGIRQARKVLRNQANANLEVEYRRRRHDNNDPDIKNATKSSMRTEMGTCVFPAFVPCSLRSLTTQTGAKRPPPKSAMRIGSIDRPLAPLP